MDKLMSIDELLQTDFDLDFEEIDERENLSWLLINPGFIIFAS